MRIRRACEAARCPGYDTGLHVSQLVTLALVEIMPAACPDVWLLEISRGKDDSEGEGAAGLTSHVQWAEAAWTTIESAKRRGRKLEG